MTVKYRCIKDLGGLGILTVGKVYDVENDRNVHTVTNDVGRVILMGDKTILKYFERV